ncbi:Ube4b, partial [Symbiodinium microadriaticum]
MPVLDPIPGYWIQHPLALSFLIAIPALNPVILSPVPFLSHGPDVRLRIVTFDNNAAYLRLEQVRPTETRAPPASNAINVPWPASTMRHDDQIFQAVLAGEVKVHATRQPVNMKTLKVSMNNIQRSLKLKTGTGAGWSDEADDWLIRVLAPPKQKRTNIPGDKQALEDADDVLAIENIKSENVNKKNEPPIVSEETLDKNVPENTESMDEAPSVSKATLDKNVPENNEPMDADSMSDTSDSSYSSSSTHKSVLRRRVRELESLLNEATQDLWSANDVEAAKGFVSSNGFLKDAAKFPTQIFWLTLRAFHVLLVPVMKENLCMLCAASFFHGKNMATMEANPGLFKDLVLAAPPPTVIETKVMAFCLSAAFPDKVVDDKHDAVVRVGLSTSLSQTVAPLRTESRDRKPSVFLIGHIQRASDGTREDSVTVLPAAALQMKTDHAFTTNYISAPGDSGNPAFGLWADLSFCTLSSTTGVGLGHLVSLSVTPQWAVLPSCIFEDIIEILEIVIQSNPQQKPSSELFLHLDPTLLLYLVTFILGNGQHVKNPNLRGKAATILKGLIGNPSYCHLVENSPVLISGIIPGCIRVFTAVEKTKQSYYDIRMQLKYQLRIPIMELFERTLPLEAHKKALKSFATEFPDEFLKFLNN